MATTTEATYPPGAAVAQQGIDEFHETTIRQAGVPSGRSRLIAAIDQHEKAVDALREALSPVLTDGVPMDAEAIPKPGSPDYSSHANWLHEQAVRIECSTDAVQRVLNRVDL